MGFATASNATATSQYTGNSFSELAQSPYMTADFVTMTITLRDALGANTNLVIGDGNLITLSANDGVQTLDLNTASLTPNFLISTDAQGNIDQWFVVLDGGAFTGIDTVNIAETAFDSAQTPFAGGGAVAIGNNPGTWALIPEPGTATLLAMGLVAMAGARRYRYDTPRKQPCDCAS